MSLRLRFANSEDVQRLAHVSAAAFEHDELNKALFPPHLKAPDGSTEANQVAFREQRLRARLNQPIVRSIVVVDEALDGLIVGFAQWEAPSPPDQDEELSEADAAKEREAEEATYPASLDRAALQMFLDAGEKEYTRIFGPRGHKDAWYALTVAVDPGHQRRGIGKMLLTWGMEAAKADGRDCYLIATPVGKPLYASQGFEDIGGAELCGAYHTSMIIRGRPVGDGKAMVLEDVA